MIEYKVDTENRVVIAYLKDANRDVDDLIKRNILGLNAGSNQYRFYTEFYDLTDNYHNMPKYFIGVARCSLDDDFDVETGKEIAKRRCLAKYYSSKYKRLLKVATVFNKVCMMTTERMNKALDGVYSRLYEQRMWLLNMDDPEMANEKHDKECSCNCCEEDCCCSKNAIESTEPVEEITVKEPVTILKSVEIEDAASTEDVVSSIEKKEIEEHTSFEPEVTEEDSDTSAENPIDNDTGFFKKWFF